MQKVLIIKSNFENSTDTRTIIDGIEDIQIIESRSDKKYFYFIQLNTWDWIRKMENDGFSNLPEDIKKDIRNRKCKIILFAADEGYYGMSGHFFSYPNWDLEILQKWCEIERFPSDSITFICMNMIVQTHNTKKNLNYSLISTSHPSETHISLDKHDINGDSNFIELKKEPKLFLTYNFAYHPHRLYLLESLNKNNLLKNSYHSFIFKKEFQEAFKTGISQYKKLNGSFLDKKWEYLIEKLPMEIKDDYNEENYSHLDFKGQVVVRNHYENSFLSIISETLTENGTVYFSEKTFKPIYMCHPFLSVASKHSLKKLKELGYKTFDKWWDESYDECDNYIDRIDMICKILLDLNSKSYEELKKIKNEMKDVLIHNYKNFIGRYKQNPSPIIEAIKEEYKKFVKQ